MGDLPPGRRAREKLVERVHKWATDKSRVCLCFDNPSHETIRSSVAWLAEICLREFGVPSRIANVERART